MPLTDASEGRQKKIANHAIQTQAVEPQTTSEYLSMSRSRRFSVHHIRLVSLFRGWPPHRVICASIFHIQSPYILDCRYILAAKMLLFFINSDSGSPIPDCLVKCLLPIHRRLKATFHTPCLISFWEFEVTHLMRHANQRNGADCSQWKAETGAKTGACYSHAGSRTPDCL
jgi:hypothetical protein